ncbi:DUF2249 domain-containing protein [Nostocoides sp. F2B08]|uniref:DUF2249 domain-containing protein n=1 Tax=Nostocoides sp. F2B08 TaxID=2653936 RepID=UPI001262AE35|nr:DUF2249 domain-containing protein [Tetrasphaera sp. F2B08]KAB7744200.1 DUF2249 domain-containing protein [Tetrasphaera sp. F2B08]
MTELSLTEKTPGCACGADHGEPELDARTIPHAIRHATIFGALSAIAPGGSLILVAPHDPQPLLAQIADREGDDIEVSYLEKGPQAWRLRLARR